MLTVEWDNRLLASRQDIQRAHVHPEALYKTETSNVALTQKTTVMGGEKNSHWVKTQTRDQIVLPLLALDRCQKGANINFINSISVLERGKKKPQAYL